MRRLSTLSLKLLVVTIRLGVKTAGLVLWVGVVGVWSGAELGAELGVGRGCSMGGARGVGMSLGGDLEIGAVDFLGKKYY